MSNVMVLISIKSVMSSRNWAMFHTIATICHGLYLHSEPASIADGFILIAPIQGFLHESSIVINFCFDSATCE